MSSRERVAREGRAAWRWRWSEGEAEEMEEERGAEEMEEEREAMGRSRLLGNANPWGGDPGDARGSEAPSRDGRLGSRHSYAVKTMSDSADAAVDVDPHVHPRHAAYNRAGDQASPRERSHFWCLGWPYREDGFWDSRRGAGETFWETDRGYGSEDGFWERRDTVSRTVRGDFGEGAGRRGAEEHACAREPRDNVSMTATRARASENHDATASTEGALEDSHSQVGDSEDELTCSPASPGSGKSPQSAGLAARLAWEPRRCPAVGAQLARLGNEYHTCKATGCAFSDPGCPAFGPGGSEDRGRPQLGNSVAERISGWPDECYGAVRAYASAGDSHGDGSDAETGVERRPSVQEAMSRAGGPEEDIQPNEWLACGATATGVASSTPGVDYGARGVVIDSSLEARAREQKRGVPWGPGDKEQQCWRQDNESNITRQQQSTDTWHFSPVARPKRVRMRRCSATAAETNESSIGGTGRGEGEELCGGRGEQRRKLASTGGNTTSLTESQRGWQARSKGRDLVRSGGSAWRGGTWGHKKAIWNVRTAKNLELRLAHAALAASASDMRLFWRPGITSKRECECPPPQQQRAFLERPWRNGMATFPMSRGGSPQCDDKSGSFEGAQGFMRASSGSRCVRRVSEVLR